MGKGKGGQNKGKFNKTENSMTAWNTLTQTDKEAIGAYTIDAYDISNSLRSGEELTQGYKMLQSDLDTAISKGELKADTTVYRGVSAKAFGINASDDFNDANFMTTKDIQKSLKERIGKTFSDKGYMSTTFDKNIAQGFANGSNSGVLLKITAKKGTKGMFIGSDSDFGNEKEMLFGRNSNITIKKVRNEKGNIIVECDLQSTQISKKIKATKPSVKKATTKKKTTNKPKKPMSQLDKLAKKLKDGKITQEQYNKEYFKLTYNPNKEKRDVTSSTYERAQKEIEQKL